MVAAVMVLYSASTSTFSYALFGQVTLDYALFFFLWAALWTFVGQVGLEFLPKRYRMASFIVLAVGVTILLSVSLYVGHAIDTIVADPRAAVAIPRFCPS